MSCIVGLVHENRVYLGADSAMMDDTYHVEISSPSKIQYKQPMVMAFCGEPRVRQLVQFGLKVPPLEPADPIFEYVVCCLIPNIRECVKEGGYCKEEEGIEVMNTQILLGIKGRLFKIHSDYQVTEPPCGYIAAGSGRDYAMGSLFSTKYMEPHKRIETALEAAEFHNGSVRRPFIIVGEVG